MASVKLLQQLPLQHGAGVHSCSVADPYILIVYENGHVVLLTLKVDAHGDARLMLTNPDLEQVRGNCKGQRCISLLYGKKHKAFVGWLKLVLRIAISIRAYPRTSTCVFSFSESLGSDGGGYGLAL